MLQPLSPRREPMSADGSIAPPDDEVDPQTIAMAQAIESELEKDRAASSSSNAGSSRMSLQEAKKKAEADAAAAGNSWSLSSAVDALNSFVRNVKNKVFISQEMEESCYEVCSLITRFWSDVDVSPLQLLTALLVLQSYENTRRLAIHTRVTPQVEIIEELHYWSRFAIGAYGWALLYGLNWKVDGVLVGFVKDAKTNVKVLLEHTGLVEEDLIFADWNSKPFAPGHYLALDRKKKAIVLCVRGTFSARDAITDLICTYEQFGDHKVHSGMLLAAQRLLDDKREKLLSLLKANPGYSVRLVGHSLGAGTAALVGMLLRKERAPDYRSSLLTLRAELPDLDLHCYCYGTPAVASIAASEKCRPYVSTVIHHDDIVPRLSYGSLEDLKKHILAIVKQKDVGSLGRLWQTMAAGAPLGQSLTNKISNFLRVPATPPMRADLAKEIVPAERLWVPGTVYWLHRTGRRHHIELSAAPFFADILLSSTTFVDHMPFEYEDHFPQVIADLLRPPGSAPAQEPVRVGELSPGEQAMKESLDDLSAALQNTPSVSEELEIEAQMYGLMSGSQIESDMLWQRGLSQ